ncbi:bifunctional acetate--CoA ligase family protein/GNAT family N-acetyltransferase [Pedococcus sp. 5OH_020]|uniref:bifunctional acetate--CoA ligase family protein/GNAT family N-acetyltransferase n=1 Tax=Pedococcus sp. 5OH_020 TaxID=2989814 RepID=UPI0022EA070B|nr:bifunctional GNAT family N-acetyltransferase/acetate--CoA ligase family protein [Pedococcus sp. 5OH_020]
MTDAGGRPAGYPAQWEADVVLRDGSVAHLRPITPSDVEAVHRFHAGQSDESIYMRFFAPLRKLSDRDVTRFTNVDYHDRVALVATVRGEIIGIGRFDRITPVSAEVAFNISDSYQGRGIGSVLLEHLAVIAWESGVEEFTAEVLPQNRKMISVFSDAGYEVDRRFQDGVVSLRFQIQPTERSEAVRLSREHRAESVSMHSVLFPDSIAVVGASRRADSIGHHILANIQAGGFHGAVHAVNREAMEVLGLPAHARLSDIPDGVDLAVVAVPAEEVLDVVADCAEAGVKTLLVVTAGFAEAGDAGEELQRRLLTAARESGMRVLGPNSFGVINNHPDVRLNASLAPALPPAGRLGLFAQSGALGIAVLASAARRGLGISVFASAGNRVDVSGNDFMQYWIDDQDTDTVGLYLESMGNPRKFSRIARRLASTKPVIVVKSGVSSYGVPPGHRARPTRVRPEAFDAMLRQAGVIRVENVHQMFDVAQLVTHQHLPGGNRVAIVGNSDALGALTAEACVSWGLEVAHGPVSLPSDARGEQFAEALRSAFGDSEVDSVLTCFIPPLVTLDEDVATAVRDAAMATDKPCLATFLGMRGVSERLSGTAPDGRRVVVPAYSMPEDAVRALAGATRYAEWRARDRGVPVRPAGIDREAAEQLVEKVLAESPDGRRLTQQEVTALLEPYGVRVWGSVPVRTVEEAVAAAESIGYPVVVKSVAPLMRHQPGLSGIRVDLRSEAQLREAFAGLNDRLAPLSANSFVVQRMAAPGVSCVVRTDEDPLFGPVVSFSIAGPPTELLGDIGYRIPPLTDVDVSDLISSVKAAPMLHGHRGAAPVHRAALSDLVARVSVLADNLPEIASLVLNPVNAHPAGVDVLGAEVVLAPTPRRKDTGRRTLT